MSKQPSAFWTHFQSQDFKQAQAQLATLDSSEQAAILAELFQKSGFHQKPFMLSVHKGTIKNDKSFAEFYQSWLPPEAACNEVEKHGQIFQQCFPIPLRVVHAVNMNTPNEIVTVSFNWVKSKKEEQELMDYIEKAMSGKDEINEQRHNSQKKVIDRELLGMYVVKSDDNLGTPF